MRLRIRNLSNFIEKGFLEDSSLSKDFSLVAFGKVEKREKISQKSSAQKAEFFVVLYN